VKRQQHMRELRVGTVSYKYIAMEIKTEK
jgi:hypothetical protein